MEPFFSFSRYSESAGQKAKKTRNMRRYFSQESQCRQAIKPKILCLGKMSKEKKIG
jgi:hypothetical protein